MNSTNFENHHVLGILEQIESRLTANDAKEKIDIENYNFIISTCSYIKDRLKLTIPTLVLDADLNELSSELSNATIQLNNYLGSNNIGYLDNSIKHLYTSLTRVRNLPLPISKGDYSFSKAVSTFESIVKEKLGVINQENKNLKAQVASLSELIDTKQQELTRLSGIITQKEQEIQNINSTFKTEFNNIKNATNQNFETDRKNFRNEINEDHKKFREEFEELKTNVNTTFSISLLELQKKLDEARKIVNIIGNVGATGNFQIIANHHRKSANIWRIIAIAFMTILSCLLIYTIWDISVNTFDWLKSLIRVVAAGILSYPATYAAQESSKHRKEENYNRKIELELASVNPFIEILDESKKQIIKEKLVDKYFGNHNEITNTRGDNKDVDIPISAFEKIVKSVSSLLNK